MGVGVGAQSEHIVCAKAEMESAVSAPHELIRHGEALGAKAVALAHWHAKSVAAVHPTADAADAIQSV